MSEEVDQNSVPSDHDARWQALEEQVLDAGTEDLPDDILSLRQPQKKKAPKKAKAPSTKVPKPKQQTLNQAMSTSDMERIFSSFHGRESTEEDAIDVSKFLVDDDNEDDEDDEVSYNASDYFSTLTLQSTVSEEPASLPLPIAQKAAQHDQFLRLEDEQLTYNDEKKSGLKLSSKKQSEGGATYLAVASKKESLQVAAKISQPSNLAAVAESSPPGGDLEGLFYWIDAKEQSHLFSVDPGSVFLFGRMYSAKDGKPGFKSCCIRIHNAYRCMFLQPKKDSAHEDVVKEINEICRSQGVQQRRVKFVERYYAFGESAAPSDKNWWAKLRYPAKYPPIALKGHYQHVDSMVGATSSLIELFLIKRKLKGPGYLRIQDMVPATQRISHCELEFIVDSPKKVRADEVTRPPPLMNLASVQLHAQLDNKGVASEIVCACISVYRDVNVDQTIKHIPGEIYLGVRPVYAEAPLPVGLESYCKGMGLPGVQRFQNERALLMWLVAKLGAIDADVLIGHNFLGYTVDALLRRCQELNVTGWSTIGRLDLKNLPRLGASNSATLIVEKEACTGRLVMDSYTLAREYFKTVNYKLVSLAEQMEIEGIAKGTSQFEPGTSTMTPEDFQSAQSVFGCLLQVCNCTTLATGVISHLDIVRLTKRLTTIAGNLWSRTLYGARSERIEYLLLHSFHDLKFITPDKKGYGSKRFRDDDDDAEEGKRKAKYQGGMVLDPKCGLYSDYILLLDFNSLYPSLIQEFNICFTTVDRSGDDEANIPPPESLVCRTCSAAGVSPPCLHKCILPKVIKGLVDSRREVKRLMKAETDPNSLALLEIRQKALKLTANSMYGCLGFEHSRFHAQKLAELVTRQGRLALQTTVDLIPQINPSLRVIYGDTDSVMIQTGIKDNIKVVRDLGLELKAKINRRYQSLEIDIDGVFRAILLLKKKKYAALSVVDWQEEGKTFKKEVKGLDMVRRDWCPLSKQVSDAVLNRVLNAEGAEDILDYLMQYMRSVADHVRQGDQYTLDDFVISKSLTKEPESYQGSSFPHASVALRMRQRKELVRVGDLIPYVICDSGDKLCDRAYHVEEVRRNTSLRLDAEWYLSSQIFPPVMRLCEHIQGFSSVQLGEVMGVAFHQSARAAGTEQNADDTDDFSHCGMFKCRDLTECFPEALLLQVVCPHCLRKTPIDPHRRVEAVLADREAAPGPFDLYICTSCSRSLAVDYVANSFTQLCYQLLRQFYESGGRPAAVRAVRSQMTYFRALFDVPHAPGCPRRVKDGHYRRARRCLGIDRRLYTLAEAADPEIKERCDPVDPVHAAAEMLYKRIDHLFVNLDALFSKD